MFGFIEKIFIGSLTSINASNDAKCVFNQQCTILITLINLHPNEYS